MIRPVFNKKHLISQMIRVNYAGEYGAVRIYEGQIAASNNMRVQDDMYHMKAEEEVHLEYFTELMKKRRIRPSLFMSLWHNLGFGLGYVTSYLGTRKAMICTDSVESVIENHYQQQIDFLSNDPSEEEMMHKISKFRDEEIEHKILAGNQAPNLSYPEIIVKYLTPKASFA